MPKPIENPTYDIVRGDHALNIGDTVKLTAADAEWASLMKAAGFNPKVPSPRKSITLSGILQLATNIFN